MASLDRFEEKEYETAANQELSVGNGVWSSGQVREAILGYDAAVANLPPTHPIWTLLGVSKPQGVQPTAPLWQPGPLPPDIGLPTQVISLFIQYKRSDRVVSKRGLQWPHWQRPYYRFQIRPSQQERLANLEANLGGQALVLYAAPNFSTITEFQKLKTSGKILTRTAFVAPAYLVGHTYWSFVRPGTHGWANQGGEETPCESWSEVRRAFELSLGRSQRSTLSRHLIELATVAKEVQPGLRKKEARLRRALRGSVSYRSLDALVSMEVVSRLRGVDWFLSFRSPEERDQDQDMVKAQKRIMVESRELERALVNA